VTHIFRKKSTKTTKYKTQSSTKKCM